MNWLESKETHGTYSLWSQQVAVPSASPLKENINVDVCVIGAGVAGLNTAYMLMKNGMKVCVVEDQNIAGGQTAQTTAHISMVLDRRYFELEKTFGLEKAKRVAASHVVAIDMLEAIIAREKIECDAERVTGYLFAAQEAPQETLTQERQALHRMGQSQVHLLPHAPLESFDTGTCLSFPDQMQIHPLKYIAGMAQRLSDGGVQIYTQSHVLEIKSGPNPQVVTSSGSTVHAKKVVVATNAPINSVVAIHTKQAAYRTYAIAVPVPKGSVMHALYWDTEDPYHYIRMQPGSREAGQDILIVGGEDHKTGQSDTPNECFWNLWEWTQERFPMASEPVAKWSGQVVEPFDGLAFIGRSPGEENIFVLTGHSGNGFTYSTLGAMLICDLILGRKNDWQNLYDPSRLATHSLGNFLRENLNSAGQYADWLSFESLEKLHSLDRGQGVVINRGMRKLTAFRKDDGTLEFCSAACPHLGGVVHWNAVEKSWDCPCHGSRFDCHGKVIEGPAIRSLTPVDLDLDRDPSGMPIENGFPRREENFPVRGTNLPQDSFGPA